MEELTLEGIGWVWSGPTKMVWDADTVTLTIVVENAAIPADQDELREDLEVTFRDVSYFKVMREPGWDLDQLEINEFQEVNSLPSLGALDSSLFDRVRAPEVMFGTQYGGYSTGEGGPRRGGTSLGDVGAVRMFVLFADDLQAEFTASGYSIVRLSKRE